MTEVRDYTEKCPNCNVKIVWNDQDIKKPIKGMCSNCRREFLPTKIRFL